MKIFFKFLHISSFLAIRMQHLQLSLTYLSKWFCIISNQISTENAEKDILSIWA